MRRGSQWFCGSLFSETSGPTSGALEVTFFAFWCHLVPPPPGLYGFGVSVATTTQMQDLGGQNLTPQVLI